MRIKTQRYIDPGLGVFCCDEAILAAVVPDRRERFLQFFGVQFSDAFQIRIVKASFHELGQSQLLGLGTGLVIIHFDAVVQLHHAERENHVTDPDCREQGGSERTDVYDSSALIQTLKRRDRSAVISEFTVVVVFNDDAVIFLCPLKKAVPASYRHHRACRELVLRADIDCCRYVGRQFFYFRAVFPDRDAAHAETAVSEYAPYRHVARIFDRNMTDSHHSQYPRNVGDQLLGTCAYHDLPLRADHASGLIQIFRDLCPELRLSLAVAFRKKLLRHFVKDGRHAFFPFDKIKCLRITVSRLICGCCFRFCIFRAVAARFRNSRSAGCFSCARCCVEAGLRPADQIAFSHELFISYLYCRYAYSERIRQASERWKLLTRTNAAAAYLISEMFV